MLLSIDDMVFYNKIGMEIAVFALIFMTVFFVLTINYSIIDAIIRISFKENLDAMHEPKTKKGFKVIDKVAFSILKIRTIIDISAYSLIARSMSLIIANAESLNISYKITYICLLILAILIYYSIEACAKILTTMGQYRLGLGCAMGFFLISGLVIASSYYFKIKIDETFFVGFWIANFVNLLETYRAFRLCAHV